MQRRLVEIMGNGQRLDGGSMFGNAPRALWSRWIEPDEDNRIALATRALLVVEEKRTVLFETGVGLFFEPKLRERFGVEPDDRHVLLDSLREAGFAHEEIDVVVLSHLHFDHAGGLLREWEAEQPNALLFPNAQFVVGRRNFERNQQPHPRDRASFIADLPQLLSDSGRLELVEGEESSTLGTGYRMHYSDGHTPGMMLTEIETEDGPVVFVADLAPGAAWTHLPITMGYDRCAETIVDEKTKLFADLIDRKARLFFTHDPTIGLARLVRDERGRYQAIAE